MTIKGTTTYLKVKESLWKNWVTTPIQADKWRAAIVMDVKDYVNEAHPQLNNKDHYKKLNKDLAITNAKLVGDTIQRFKNAKLLREKIADRLKVSNPRTPKFYMQPKIRNKDNSGWPVVNSIATLQVFLNAYTATYKLL